MIGGDSSCSGTALFTVLLLSVLMYFIATTMLIFTMREIRRTDRMHRSHQAFYAAESAISMGISKLRDDSNYRQKNDSEYISIGKNPATLTVQTYDGIDDEAGYYRSSLPASLYLRVLRGIGLVSGAQMVVKRIVEREIVVKPFVLFAHQNLTVRGRCTIDGKHYGNLHGNHTVTIGKNVSVKDADVTSHTTVSVKGTSSPGTEPEIAFPEFSFDHYFPQYTYNGEIYDAEPLTLSSVIELVADDEEVELPGSQIKIYKGKPDSSTNPAGVFYLDSIDESSETLTVIEVEGTVIIRSSGSLTMRGVITITPVENFPALISEKSLSLTLLGNLDRFSAGIPENRIHGLIYSSGNISLTGENTTGEIISGSIWGRNITIQGNPVFKMVYDPALMSDSPPGIELIEQGAWKEIIE